MILGALNDYYQRLLEDPKSGIAMPGYSQEKISFGIVLSAQGEVVEVIDLREDSGKKKFPKMLSVPASFKRPGSGAAPFFLWDKSSYVLGVTDIEKKKKEGKTEEEIADRLGREHAAFKTRHLDALTDCDDAGLSALRRFLEGWQPEHFQDHPKFAPLGDDFIDSNVVFRLQDDEKSSAGLTWLHQRASAKRLWEKQQAGADAAALSSCLVTGEAAPIARLHPAIKGVAGAQTMGASIVSFNLDAFSSWVLPR